MVLPVTQRRGRPSDLPLLTALAGVTNKSRQQEPPHGRPNLGALLAPPSLSEGCRFGNVLPGEAAQPGPQRQACHLSSAWPAWSHTSQGHSRRGRAARRAEGKPPRTPPAPRLQTRPGRRGSGGLQDPSAAVRTLPGGSTSTATQPTPDCPPRPPLAAGALPRKERGHGRRTPQARRKKRTLGSGRKHVDTVRASAESPQVRLAGPVCLTGHESAPPGSF